MSQRGPSTPGFTVPTLAMLSLAVLIAALPSPGSAAVGAAGSTSQGSCVPSSTSLCLTDSQFEVTVTWEDFNDNSGPGRVVDNGTDDSGLFWFFEEENWELLVKVLDGCGFNGNFWVFSAATTNVHYELVVTRLENGAQRRYVNQLGVSAPAVTDTAAFPCGLTAAAKKIVPPADGGMYLGQHEWTAGDITTLEETAGRHAALWSPYPVFDETLPPEAPEFDADAATDAWQDGRVVLVGAWDAVDLAQSGIGIDRVLSGEFDGALAELADSFRAFGRPMFFSSGREPNGIGLDYLGGFGADGTESLWWALENQGGFNRFDPSGLPNAQLYADLGDPQVCDGVERLAALHRYYHDFFVRREGLDFLTFEGMGWGSQSAELVYNNEIRDAGFDDSQSRALALSCFDYRNFYPGDEYVDWVTLTFYMLDFYAADWPEFDEDIFLPHDFWLDELEITLALVSEAAPGKPVMFIELGLPDGRNQDSALAAEKVNAFFNLILDYYPQVAAFSLWSFADFFDVPGSPLYFPFDCLIRPGTEQGDAFRAIIDAHPGRFHSCVRFSDGGSIPACSP